MIPSVSLPGRKPEALKNSELKFWLKCRGDTGEGLKTKKELLKRVHENITEQVKVKEIVDPVPDRIYSRMKEKRSTSTDLVNYSERF